MPPEGTVSCSEIVGDLLADYHDGLLPEERKDAVESHLKMCRGCLNMVRSYSASTRIVKETLWTDTPEHCEKSLLAYLRKHGAL